MPSRVRDIFYCRMLIENGTLKLFSDLKRQFFIINGNQDLSVFAHLLLEICKYIFYTKKDWKSKFYIISSGFILPGNHFLFRKTAFLGSEAIAQALLPVGTLVAFRNTGGIERQKGFCRFNTASLFK